jgi:PAS domain S-box-containing protein
VSTSTRDVDYLAHSDFQSLAEHAPDIIARFDRDMQLLYINPAVEKLTEMPRAELVGASADQLPFPPELRSIFIKRCLRVFQTGQLAEVDLLLPSPTGARHFSTRIVPVKDEAGVTISVLTVSRDVTERVQSEERQRFLAEFSARLVESPDYESTLLNLANLMLEMMADGCAIDLEMPDGAPHRMTLAVKHPGISVPEVTGELLTDSCISLPLKARGRKLGQITLCSDVARHRYDAYDLDFASELAARAALIVDNARLYQEARNASMAKSAFLATMSHELRTPLNAILGYTELMELGVAGPINQQQTQQLERISASAWHLLSVIEEILTFSRVEAGREEVRLEAVPLRDLMEETAAMIEPVAQRKAIEFEVELNGLDGSIRTDRGKLRQILLNLLSNAVKFTETGGVKFTAVRGGGGVHFEVRDSGLGIAPENLERVFEPFWQGTNGSTRKIGGTGLGLTVSRQLAQLMGGEVHVRSSLGQGSVFTVFVPSANPAA